MRKMKCPGGHVLPHKEGKRECTPLKCAAKGGAAKAPKVPSAPRKKARAKPAEDEGVMLPAEVPPETGEHGDGPLVDDENVYLVEARKARERITPSYKLKDGEDPVDATLAHTARLLPSAAQQVEFQLLYGDAKGRFDAALAIFDQHGIRKKEGVVGGGSTIILNVSGGGLRLPWAKEAAHAVVDSGTSRSAAEREIDAGAERVGGLLPDAGEREGA